MEFSATNGYYPREGVFDEAALFKSLQRDEEAGRVEKQLFNDTIFLKSPGLGACRRLHLQPLEDFYNGTQQFRGRVIDCAELAGWYQTPFSKDAVDAAIRDLSGTFFNKRIKEQSGKLNQARMDLIRSQSMREAIQETLSCFREEKRLVLLLLELERCTVAGIKKQASFRRPMLFNKELKDVGGSQTDMPPSTTIERFQFCQWFDGLNCDTKIIENISFIFPEVFLEQTEVLKAFLELKHDPLLVDIAYDIFRKLDRDAAVVKTSKCILELENFAINFLSRDNISNLLSEFKLVPFLGLYFLNILTERDDALADANKHQEAWPTLMEVRFSLKDRVNWKYSRLGRFLVEDAFKKQYFSQRQNVVLDHLKTRYGRGGEVLFEPYFTKTVREVVPLNLDEWEEKPVEKKKQDAKQKNVVLKKAGDSSGVKNVEGVPVVQLTAVQERLNRVSQFRFSYGSRVYRFFNIDPEKNLSNIRQFRDKGELHYEKATDQALLLSWKQHCFPAIELISEDPDFKKRFTRENSADLGPGFWMMCRLECEKKGPLDGRVRIGFDVSDGETIIHRFFNPGNEDGMAVKHLKRTLGDGKASDEEDCFYRLQNENQWFFRDQLLEVEGEGHLQRIKIRDTARKMTITAIQIPSWII